MDDINDKGVDNDENVYAPSVGNSICGIIKQYDLKAHMLSVDPDAAHASEFLSNPI